MKLSIKAMIFGTLMFMVSVSFAEDIFAKEWKMYTKSGNWANFQCSCWDFPSCEKNSPGFNSEKQMKKDHYKKAKERNFVDVRTIAEVLMINQCSSQDYAKKVLYWIFDEGEGYRYRAGDQSIPGAHVFAADMINKFDPRYIAIISQKGDAPEKGSRLHNLVYKGRGYEYGTLYHFQLVKIAQMKDEQGAIFSVPVFKRLGPIVIDPKN